MDGDFPLDPARTAAIDSAVEDVLDGLLEKHKAAVFTQGQLQAELARFKAEADYDASHEIGLTDLIDHPEIVGLHITPDAEGGTDAAASGEPASKRFTTRTIREEEEEAAEAAQRLFEKKSRPLSQDLIDHVAKKWKLSAQQKTAFEHAVRGEDLAIVTGHAGTGKGLVARAILDAYQLDAVRSGQELKVVGVSPTHKVRLNFKDLGFGEAATAHSVDIERNSVLIADEATLFDTPTFKNLVVAAREANCKLILFGDPKQLPAVKYGGLFPALLKTYPSAEITEIKRQVTPWLRDLVQKLSDTIPTDPVSAFTGALDTLQKQKVISWSKSYSPEKTYKTLTKHWRQSLDAGAKVEDLLVVAYTNKQVDALNRLLHESYMKRLGASAQKSLVTTKGGVLELAKGDHVQIEEESEQFQLGKETFGTILSVEPYTGHRMEYRGGRPISVESPEAIITADIGGHKKSWDTAKFDDFKYGYATTVHKAEGTTCGECFVFMPHYAGYSELIYTALTRPRHAIRLYVSGMKGTSKDVITLGRSFAQSQAKVPSIDYPTVAQHQAELENRMDWQPEATLPGRPADPSKRTLPDAERAESQPPSKFPRLTHDRDVTGIRYRARERELREKVIADAVAVFKRLEVALRLEHRARAEDDGSVDRAPASAAPRRPGAQLEDALHQRSSHRAR